ncbi:hypothetical protein Hypma_014566 [Hypsizygus marmoreus]|uniref:Uncharacterized protein n=1 Tax=Hypsizygus marmoreus TaxID=39966 RepID=A0A369JAD1_HYPMA|nr:hypothetical protein Hypma_014566 [Hypsizygus marmoreus]
MIIHSELCTRFYTHTSLNPFRLQLYLCHVDSASEANLRLSGVLHLPDPQDTYRATPATPSHSDARSLLDSLSFHNPPSSSPYHHTTDPYNKSPRIAFSTNTSLNPSLLPAYVTQMYHERSYDCAVDGYHCWPEERGVDCERHEEEDGECTFYHRFVAAIPVWLFHDTILPRTAARTSMMAPR